MTCPDHVLYFDFTILACVKLGSNSKPVVFLLDFPKQNKSSKQSPKPVWFSLGFPPPKKKEEDTSSKKRGGVPHKTARFVSPGSLETPGLRHGAGAAGPLRAQGARQKDAAVHPEPACGERLGDSLQGATGAQVNLKLKGLKLRRR